MPICNCKKKINPFYIQLVKLISKKNETKRNKKLKTHKVIFLMAKKLNKLILHKMRIKKRS